jgi:L-iditol 2-dehydrogenase
MQFMATPPVNGALVHYLVYPADFCFKLPDHMTYEEGALIEPLALSIHGCTRGEVKVASRVLITGAGPVGLCTLLVAKASGATKVVVVDQRQNRLDIAKSMGADATFLANTPDLLDKLREYNFTHSIECSGANQLGTAMQVTGRAGRVVMLGRPASSELELPLQEAVDNEVDIVGAFRYHGQYPNALALVESGKVNVAGLVTHRFGMNEIQEAFEMADTGSDGAIKVMIYLEELSEDRRQSGNPPPSESSSQILKSPSRFSSAGFFSRGVLARVLK